MIKKNKLQQVLLEKEFRFAIHFHIIGKKTPVNGLTPWEIEIKSEFY